MAKIKLTETAVEAAQPQAQDIEVRDTVVPGFLCEIAPAAPRPRRAKRPRWPSCARSSWRTTPRSATAQQQEGHVACTTLRMPRQPSAR